MVWSLGTREGGEVGDLRTGGRGGGEGRYHDFYANPN